MNPLHLDPTFVHAELESRYGLARYAPDIAQSGARPGWLRGISSAFLVRHRQRHHAE
ncbi:MAG TPA: hypothetical protein P5181_06360 [Dermatophilaceae bacterium]|nr:hypothetical protein [Dermatophilaceae bacterium]